jgi:hypothetical protein
VRRANAPVIWPTGGASVKVALVRDMTLNPLPYACGPTAAERPRGTTANWRRGVLPNRGVGDATLAVIALPGDPGVGKTSAVKCVPLAPRNAKARAHPGG